MTGLLTYFTAVCIALILGALAAISILIAQSMARDTRPPRIRHGHLPLVPLPACLFCGTRQCNNPQECTCEDPCDMPLCRAPETETVP